MHTLGSGFGAAVRSCIPMAEQGTSSFTLKGAGGTGLTHNFETRGEVAWFYHHAVSMTSSKKRPKITSLYKYTRGQLKSKQNQVSSF